MNERLIRVTVLEYEWGIAVWSATDSETFGRRILVKWGEQPEHLSVTKHRFEFKIIF